MIWNAEKQGILPSVFIFEDRVLRFSLCLPTPPTTIIPSTCNDLNEVPDQSAEKHLVEFLSHKSSTPHTVAGELSSPSAEVKFMNLLQLTQVPKGREVIH